LVEDASISDFELRNGSIWSFFLFKTELGIATKKKHFKMLLSVRDVEHWFCLTRFNKKNWTSGFILHANAREQSP
jgi:hypothetical protein